jgi:RNA polymerase sigma factor (TIGR02999 family)
MPNTTSTEVTTLLKRIQKGDQTANEKLIPIVFTELRRLARHHLRNERLGHTLQPTALVNEAYIRLAGFNRMDWQSRSHFLGMASGLMRQILIDYARKRQSLKRGGDKAFVELDENRALLSPQQSVELIELDRALQELEKMNPRHAKIVELRYFGGLSVEEAAEAMSVAPITVKRDWAAARAWLRSRMER